MRRRRSIGIEEWELGQKVAGHFSDDAWDGVLFGMNWMPIPFASESTMSGREYLREQSCVFESVDAEGVDDTLLDNIEEFAIGTMA